MSEAVSLMRGSTQKSAEDEPLVKKKSVTMAKTTSRDDGKLPCFFNSVLTIKDVDTAKQQYTVSGYVNCLWQCPDLETETQHQDYYGPKHTGPTIKDGLAAQNQISDYKTSIDRPYVQKEIRWAKKYNKPIITVFEKESHRPGFFDYGRAAEKYAGTEFEFLLGIDAIPYQRDTFQREAMMKNIFAKTMRSKSGADLGAITPCEAATDPLNEPGQWDFFLSHHQAHGGDQTQTMQMGFAAKGKTTWYDNAMLDKSESAMEEGVKHSDFFLLVLTGDSSEAGGGTPRAVQNKQYVHDSVTRTGTRKYVSGFQLSFDHAHATPFNPYRMFDKARVVNHEIKACNFYYYPTKFGNEDKLCGGLVKMATEFEATLTQRLNMSHFPFDRQILQMLCFVRRDRWHVHEDAPDFVDTGYDTDKDICTTVLSQSVVRRPTISLRG